MRNRVDLFKSKSKNHDILMSEITRRTVAIMHFSITNSIILVVCRGVHVVGTLSVYV